MCGRHVPDLVCVAQAEVDYLESPTVVGRLQEQVFRLQVPVRHVVIVQVLDAVHLFHGLSCKNVRW